MPSFRTALDTGISGQILFLYFVNLAFIALLLLCAANVATLVFGRTVTRESEITVRTALAAAASSRNWWPKPRCSRRSPPSPVSASARYALGWVRRAWEQGQGSAMPFWWSERLTVETFLYTALLVIIAALMIGGIPALKATGPQMQTRRHPLEGLFADRPRRGGRDRSRGAHGRPLSAESGGNGIVDGITLGALVAVFILTVAAVSCTVPLRRALRVDPTEALRVS